MLQSPFMVQELSESTAGPELPKNLVDRAAGLCYSTSDMPNPATHPGWLDLASLFPSYREQINGLVGTLSAAKLVKDGSLKKTQLGDAGLNMIEDPIAKKLVVSIALAKLDRVDSYNMVQIRAVAAEITAELGLLEDPTKFRTLSIEQVVAAILLGKLKLSDTKSAKKENRS